MDKDRPGNIRIGLINFIPSAASHRLRIGVNLDLRDHVITAWMLRPKTHLLLRWVSEFGIDRLSEQVCRLLEVLRIIRSTVVICSKPAARRDIDLLEIASLCGRGIIVDISDNHYLNPHANASLINILDRGVEMATLVTVPSATLASQLLATKHAHVAIVEDAIDDVCLPPTPLPYVSTGRTVYTDMRAKLISDGLLWFGAAGWNQLYGGQPSSSLAQLVPAVRDLAEHLDVELSKIMLRTVSNESRLVARFLREQLGGITLSSQDWSINTMQAALHKNPLVLLRYVDSQFNLGKSPNRVELALAAACTVIVNRFLPGWCSELRSLLTVLGEWNNSVDQANPRVSTYDYVASKRTRVRRDWVDIVLRSRRCVRPSWKELMKRSMMYVIYG